MQDTINAILNLKNTLHKRSLELEELISELEELTCDMGAEEEETEEAQELIHKTNLLYQELRLNDKLMRELSLCEYCKLSDHNLCNICG